MAELKAMCEAEGFSEVQTYIASGNVVFGSSLTATKVKSQLEAALLRYAGKPVGVMVRTGAEMARVLADNPFPDGAPNRTVAIFLDTAPGRDVVDTAKGRKDEQIELGKREVYVHYGDGMGQSRLALPAAQEGTARNINTVTKLAAMAAAR
jgi:uncharacterized protein (DUF1697 family)